MMAMNKYPKVNWKLAEPKKEMHEMTSLLENEYSKQVSQFPL